MAASPLLATHGGDRLPSKAQDVEGAALGMGAPGISMSPFLFARKRDRTDTSSVLAHRQVQGLFGTYVHSH